MCSRHLIISFSSVSSAVVGCRWGAQEKSSVLFMRTRSKNAPIICWWRQAPRLFSATQFRGINKEFDPDPNITCNIDVTIVHLKTWVISYPSIVIGVMFTRVLDGENYLASYFQNLALELRRLSKIVRLILAPNQTAWTCICEYIRSISKHLRYAFTVPE